MQRPCGGERTGTVKTQPNEKKKKIKQNVPQQSTRPITTDHKRRSRPSRSSRRRGGNKKRPSKDSFRMGRQKKRRYLNLERKESQNLKRTQKNTDFRSERVAWGGKDTKKGGIVRNRIGPIRRHTSEKKNKKKKKKAEQSQKKKNQLGARVSQHRKCRPSRPKEKTPCSSEKGAIQQVGISCHRKEKNAPLRRAEK